VNLSWASERPPQAPTAEASKRGGSRLSVKITADSSQKQTDRDSTEAKPAPSFGRSRNRRGDALRKRSQSSDQQVAGDKPDKAPGTQPAYTADKLSFGRSRKKGPR